MTALSISELAERTGVSTETIRYYERAGLLSPPARTSAGHRRYGELGIRELHAVRSARALGFTLREIRAMLDSARAAPTAFEVIRTVVEERLASIEADIQRLEAQHRLLRQEIERCDDGSRAIVIPGATPGFTRLGEHEVDTGTAADHSDDARHGDSRRSCECVLIDADATSARD